MITVRNENGYVVITMPGPKAKEVADQLGEIFYELDPSAVFEEWPEMSVYEFFEKFSDFMETEGADESP